MREKYEIKEGHDQRLPKAVECFADPARLVAGNPARKPKAEHDQGRENKHQKHDNGPIERTT